MGVPEILILAVGLAMDAFAVSISQGLCMAKVGVRKPLIIGLYFGGFQAAMPLIGYLAASRFAALVNTFDHWIAFVLLCLIGGKMIFEGVRRMGPERGKGAAEVCEASAEPALTPAHMLPLAVATSIDALAVGVSFAFLRVDIAIAVTSIGVITLAISMLGVVIGNIVGLRFKSYSELGGGIVLVLIGLKILLDHLL